ncbi:MAG: amidohydrolase family protein [Acidobacteriota bacterium]
MSHHVVHQPMLIRRLSVALICCLLLASIPLAQTARQQTPTSGKRYPRTVIRNAVIIDGNGTPASGPKDIVIENNVITEIAALDPVALKEGRAKRPAQGDAEIDATGKYVLPGLINLHGHTQDERGGNAQPVDYCLKMWLACGITTVRDVGATKKTLEWRDKSARNEIAAPKIFAYGIFTAPPTPKNADEARARVRDLKAAGYDGIKLFGVDRDIMQAMEDEARKVGLRVAHHVGVEETNAWDDIKFGTTSIEHWYGIPDAAIESGRQNFPPSYNQWFGQN